MEEDISPINVISPICFTLAAWELAMTTSHQRSIFKMKKPVYIGLNFFSKYLNSFLWSSP
jgi:hypothetical protein